MTRAGVKWTEHGPGVIGAFVAEMDFGIAPQIAAALHRAVDLAQVGYLSKPLMSELADACAGRDRIHTGWSPDPAWIHPLPDVVRGLEVAIRSFSAPGAAVILPTPAYMPFFDVPGEVGRSLLTAPMIEDGRPAPLRSRRDPSRVRTGRWTARSLQPVQSGRPGVHPRGVARALSEVVDSCGGRVFADEIHAPLVYEPNVHIPYASVSEVAAGHSVTAISASKAWNLPGLKCANLLLTNTDDAERWQHVGLLASHGASTIGAIANTVAYRAGDPVAGGRDGNARRQPPVARGDRRRADARHLAPSARGHVPRLARLPSRRREHGRVLHRAGRGRPHRRRTLRCPGVPSAQLRDDPLDPRGTPGPDDDSARRVMTIAPATPRSSNRSNRSAVGRVQLVDWSM